jgi:predicted TIM-barrel fold metal-dependent hydrolase
VKFPDIHPQTYIQMKQLYLALICMSIPCLAWAQKEVFDTHVHLWHGERSYKEYMRQLDSLQQPVTRFGGILIAEKGKMAQTKADNDELIALSKKYPKLVPICSVHPLDGEAALDELKRLAKLGVPAIKIHAHTQQFDVKDEQVLKFCKQAGELGLVILSDNASIKPGDSENLFDLAVKCPKTTFIFAHLGGLNFRFWNIIPVARTAKDFYNDNIYFDISAVLMIIVDSPIEEEFTWTIRNVGIDRVFLGSDYPQYSLKQATDALERLNLTEDEKNKIRYENANKLLVGGK